MCSFPCLLLGRDFRHSAPLFTKKQFITLTRAHSIIRLIAVVILALNHDVKTVIVHSSLMRKRPSHQSFSTTTTCTTQICKCPFSLSDNSVHVTSAILKSHTPCRSCLCCGRCCIQCPLGGSRSTFCGGPMWLVAVPALCWEFLLTVGCYHRGPQCPVTQCGLHCECCRASCALCSRGMLTCAVCWEGGFHTTAPQSDLEVTFTVEINMIQLEKGNPSV